MGNEVLYSRRFGIRIYFKDENLWAEMEFRKYRFRSHRHVKNKNRRLFTDNYYNPFGSTTQLNSRKICACGTLRNNRKRSENMSSIKKTFAKGEIKSFEKMESKF
jgi:hypothetical protein